MKSSRVARPKRSIRPGDVFAIGRHRVACGDAKDAGLVRKLVGGDAIALVCTDPPYGCAYVESKSAFGQKLGKAKPIENDHAQTEDEYRSFTKGWLAPIVPHLAAKNALYVFNSDKMIFALREGIRDAGWNFTQTLVWVKTHAVLGRMDYLPQHELIAYGWRGRHAFMKAKDKSVLICPKPSASPLHPTMKPVTLLRRLILNSARSNDVVYDPFLGSGSSLVAAEDTGRRCFGVEIDPEYCSTAIDRIERRAGADAIKLFGV